jgi:hypothetical protein
MKKVAIGTGSLVLLGIIAILVHVLVLGAIADAENGLSPLTALALQDGRNVGVLAPGEGRWYELLGAGTGGAFQRQMDLTLIFTPDDGNRIHHVNFQIFPADQISGWYSGDASQMQNMGAGGIVSRDGDPVTGERLWSGWVLDNDTYYVQVFNGADTSIDYSLFTDNIIAAELGESSALAPAVDVPAGADPNHPVTLAPDLHKGQLEAGQETWYAVIYDDFDSDAFEPHTFTLIFTPDDGHRIHQVGFEIFPMSQLHIWQQGDTGQMRNLGVGSVVSRDGDPLTGERLWSGWLMDGEAYLLKMYNHSDADVDYWLFPEDMLRPELGEPAPPPSLMKVPPGSSPFNTLPLDLSVNTYRLDPRQELWYSFVRDDFDDDNYEAMALTMMFTPSDGNRVHKVGFELIAADQLHIWARGDTDQLRNIGAGSVVSRDGNAETGELLWSGWLMDGETYYLKVRNDAEVPIDYWLFPGDIVRAELGEPSPLPPPINVEAGTDSNHPLPLEMGLNRGGLSPGQERWFSVVRADMDDEAFEQMTLSLFFTPDDGRRIHSVNFDTYSADQIHTWERGDTDQLRNVGAGSVVSRDDDPNTGELLWSGWLVDGETYFVRLRNDADAPIEYWLFTADVIRPELGELLAPEGQN